MNEGGDQSLQECVLFFDWLEAERKAAIEAEEERQKREEEETTVGRKDPDLILMSWIQVGPQPVQSSRVGHGNYGGALLPGEGDRFDLVSEWIRVCVW